MSSTAVPSPAPRARSGWRWLWLSAAVIVVDQLAKAWIVHHFTLFERVRVLPVLDIILTYNTGAAFSFLADASGWQRWFFVVLARGDQRDARRLAARACARTARGCSPAGWR